MNQGDDSSYHGGVAYVEALSQGVLLLFLMRLVRFLFLYPCRVVLVSLVPRFHMWSPCRGSWFGQPVWFVIGV